jgi:uncharacterized protein YgiM (DUF1202 family)
MTKINGIFQSQRLRFPSQPLLAGALLLALMGSGLTAQANGGSASGASVGAARDGAHDEAGSDGTEDDAAAAVGGQTTPTLTTGSSAVINDEPVNLRSEAGTEVDIVAELSTGTEATVVAGPVEANGITWYQIETEAGTGWVAAEYLTAADASFTAGAQIVVTTDGLNLRTAAGLDADVVTTLGNGATATILGGPTTADGYTWYQVEANAGTGWVAGEYLSPVAG